jgi:hypothetical protein
VSKVKLSSYVLDTLGYDCFMDGTIESFDAALYVNHLHVHQAFGYAVIALEPTPVSPPLVETVFMWVRPFSGAVWGVIVATFFVSAVLMAWFESRACPPAFLHACAACVLRCCAACT